MFGRMWESGRHTEVSDGFVWQDVGERSGKGRKGKPKSVGKGNSIPIFYRDRTECRIHKVRYLTKFVFGRERFGKKVKGRRNRHLHVFVINRRQKMIHMLIRRLHQHYEESSGDSGSPPRDFFSNRFLMYLGLHHRYNLQLVNRGLKNCNMMWRMSHLVNRTWTMIIPRVL